MKAPHTLVNLLLGLSGVVAVLVVTVRGDLLDAVCVFLAVGVAANQWFWLGRRWVS